MNKNRRTRLTRIIAQLEELQQELEAVKVEEQDAFDKMPESLQGSDKGVAMENVVSELENVDDNLTDAVNAIAELVG